MAKSTNGIGVLSGKAGAFVYQPNKGDKKYPQIVRGYQPNVANPKTKAQTTQRSKMNVAGQISALVAPDVLIGFGGRKRANRSAFVSHLLKIAEEVQGIMGVYCPDIKWSRSRVVPFTATASLSASVDGGLYGSIDLDGAKVGDGVRVITLVAFKTPGNYGYDSVAYRDYVKTGDTNRIIVDQPITVSNVAAAGNVTIYAYMVPFTLNEGAVSVNYGNIAAAINSGVLTGDRIEAEVIRLASAGSAVTFGQSICTAEDGYNIQQSPSPLPPLPGDAYQLTLVPNPNTAEFNWTVTPEGGDESEQYNPDDTVVLYSSENPNKITIYPKEGWEFDLVSSEGSVISRESPFEINFTEDKTLVCSFSES